MGNLFELLWNDKMTTDIIECGAREVSVEAVVRYLANPKNIDELYDHSLIFRLYKTYGIPFENARALIKRCLWYMNDYPGETEDDVRGSSAEYGSGTSAFDSGHGSEYNKHAVSGSCLAGPSRANTKKDKPSFERNCGSSSSTMQLADSLSDGDVIVISSDDSDNEVASVERGREKMNPQRKVDDSHFSYERPDSGPLSPKKELCNNEVASEERSREKKIPQRRVDDSHFSYERPASGPLSPKKELCNNEVASEERSREKKIPHRGAGDDLSSRKRNASPISPKKIICSKKPKRALVISDESDVEKPVSPVKTEEISNESGLDSDESDSVCEVVDILDHRVTRKGITEYRVQWKLGPRGEYWSDSENWVAESRMMCPDILKEYKCKKGIRGKTKKSRRSSSVSSSDDDNHRTLTRKELEAKRFRERRAKTKLLISYDKDICTTSDEDAEKRKRPAEDVVDIIERKQRGRRARPNYRA